MPPIATRSRVLSLPFLFLLGAGGAIGTVVAFGLYVTKPSLVGLLPLGLLVVFPAAVLKNFRLYWFTLFLLSLQVKINKNLNDGLAVVDALKIDYTIQHFTFQIGVTELLFLVLLAIWVNDTIFHAKPFRFPRITWLAVGYLGACMLSLVGAPSPYLGFVQLSHEIEYFIVFLFAVNFLDSKSAVRIVFVVAVVILVTQGGATLARFETGYLTPLTAGDSHQEMSDIEAYLTVDRSLPGSTVRAFGTLDSPGSTTRLCMMVIPFALLLGARNSLFGRPVVFATLAIFGMLGLILTFTRVYYILAAFQCGLAFLIMVRDGMLKRQEVILVVMAGLIALAAVSPKLYEQFTVREDSVSVRYLQYEAAAMMILDHPLLGTGLNNATGEKPKYATESFSKRDPNTQFYLEPTHNLYLSVTSEIGLVGALFFFTFFGRITYMAWRQSRQSPDPDVRLTSNALVLAFLSVAVSSFMDPLQEYSVNILLWMYAGMTLNLSRMAQSPASAVPTADHRARRQFA